ncbi:MAG: extracellular solute-binding protein [Chloroflexota bacterium]|nr:extracellular solute-binding protein [Chloroflexota bacterium]
MKQNGMTRRDFLRLSAAAATGAVMAACAPAAPEVVEVEKEVPVEKVVKETVIVEKPAKPAEKVTVRYWFSWGADLVKAIEAMMDTDEYKEHLPGVKIDPIPSIGDEKLLTSIAGGEPPDGASNVHYFSLYAKGALQPVGEWVNASDMINKEDFLDATWKTAFYEGEMHGVPGVEGWIRYGLCYNAGLVEEAGLDPDNPPLTWSETFEWHKKISEFDEAGNVRVIGLDPYDAMGGALGGGDPFMVPKSWGFQAYDEENREFNLDNPKMADALETMGQFYEHVGVDQMTGFRESFGTWGPSFNAEVQAMIIEGYWVPGETAHEAPEVSEKIRVSWLPVPDDRKGLKVQATGGHYILIPKGAKHPEEMFQFAEFLNTDVACHIIYDMIGWLPARPAFLKKIDVTKYNGLEWYAKSVEEADEVIPQELNPITAFTWKAWNDVREKVYRGDATREEGAKEMQEKCTEELQKALGLE